MKFIEYLKSPRRTVVAFSEHGFLKWMPDRFYLGLRYWAEIGKKLNIDEPETYNEKLQWLKLHDRKPEYTSYADKFEVQRYIRETIGEKYLIPLIGVYENVDEIDWEALPDRFVMKCTHGSGTNIICTDKAKLDIGDAKNKLKKWMGKNWYWYGREWPYKGIKPRIICQEFIAESDKTPDDYKVFCFNGKAKFISLHMERFSDQKIDYYDLNWNKLSMKWGNKPSEHVYEKPLCFNEMLRLSEQLAADLYHIRIDWFLVKDKLYFGEITFYDGSGFYAFEKEEDDKLLGSWISLPSDKETQNKM
jgi:hypothetical protein